MNASAGPADGGCSCEAQNLYVAADGDDAHPGTEAEPFATLQCAQQAVRRKITEGLTGDVSVTIRGGVYRIDRALLFDLADSGTDQYSVTYAAYPGDKPVISGGRAITGWQVHDDGTWSVTLPDLASGRWRFRELVVDGRRAQRARYPVAGYLRVAEAGADKRTSFTFEPGDVPQPPEVSDVDQVELVFLHDWSISRVAVQSMDHDTRVITVANTIGAAAPFFAIDGFEPHARYYLENSIAFLTEPGTWQLNEQTGSLTYRPRDGQSPDQTEIIAPFAEQLLVVRGDLDSGAPVKNLHFRGLHFQHCAWPTPANGYAAGQAGFHEKRDGSPDSVLRDALPAAVLFELAEDCSFEAGSIEHVGGSGIWLGRTCRRCTIESCAIRDVAGNGVMIGEDRSRYVQAGPWWQHAQQQVASGNVVANNLIEHCGELYFGCVGVWIGIAENTHVAHNEIRDLPYTGVSVGWMWNPTPTPCEGNVVEYNHIHHVMQKLSDGGGIYTLGLQPGTILRGNLIHDIPINAGRAESNGMFLDEGTTDLVIENNVIYNVARSPLRFHKATINLVRNNRFAMPRDVPMVRYNATDPADVKLENNAMLKTDGDRLTPAAEAKALAGAANAGLEPGRGTF